MAEYLLNYILYFKKEKIFHNNITYENIVVKLKDLPDPSIDAKNFVSIKLIDFDSVSKKVDRNCAIPVNTSPCFHINI